MESDTKRNPDRTISFFRERLAEWAKGNTREFPWRETEDPYKICVAEIMLNQTGANKVAPVYLEFIKRYPTIKRLSSGRVPTLKRIIHPLGFLYRAERLRLMAKYVEQTYGGQMPDDYPGLCSIPGVGQYTASAILCFAFGQKVPIIDTNVVRVFTRFFGLKRKLPTSAANVELSTITLSALPAKNVKQYNYAILDFAAVICSHYKPSCQNCPVESECRGSLRVHN